MIIHRQSRQRPLARNAVWRGGRCSALLAAVRAATAPSRGAHIAVAPPARPARALPRAPAERRARASRVPDACAGRRACIAHDGRTRIAHAGCARIARLSRCRAAPCRLGLRAAWARTAAAAAAREDDPEQSAHERAALDGAARAARPLAAGAMTRVIARARISASSRISARARARARARAGRAARRHQGPLRTVGCAHVHARPPAPRTPRVRPARACRRRSASGERVGQRRACR
jgi:hypothetical protein